MAGRRIMTRDFDPFEFTWIYTGKKDSHTARLIVIGVVIVGLVLLTTGVSGTFGGSADFQPAEDVERLLRFANPPLSRPDFPLMRDITSWFLALMIISGALLLHRQWQHMARCLSGLAANGVLLARTPPRSNRFSKLLGVDRMIAGVPTEKALDAIVDRVVGTLSRRSSWLTLAMVVASILLAELLVLGQANGLFQTLAPDGLSPADRATWLQDAYRNWWAGSHHVFGYLLYQVLAVFAIFVILNFQMTGMVAVYVTVAMYFVVEPSADWLNRDGRFGWSPMARLFRTVVLASALLGATLTLVIVSLGIGNYAWVSGLVVLYALLMPLSVAVPWIVFRRVEENAKKLRMAEIEQIIRSQHLDVERDIAAMAPFIVEIDRCRGARIRPLRLGSASGSTYIVLVVLPVLLAVAQIVFPIQFDGR
jgi:hypothetical protein